MKHHPEATQTTESRWLLKIWKSENLKIWNDETMKRWKYRNIEIWCMRRKEKQTEAKQIPARKPKRNKRIKKNQTSFHLLGIEPAIPVTSATLATPAAAPHPLPPPTSHFPSPTSHLPHPISHIPSPISNLPHPTSKHIHIHLYIHIHLHLHLHFHIHIHIHIHTSRFTHTHSPQQIPPHFIHTAVLWNIVLKQPTLWRRDWFWKYENMKRWRDEEMKRWK
jgi:hypothetical protein